jgi:hypothetical protein
LPTEQFGTDEHQFDSTGSLNTGHSLFGTICYSL